MAITELSPALSVTCEALYIPFVDGADVDNAPEFQQLVCDVIFKPNTKEDGVILVAGTAKGIIANTFTFLNVGDPNGAYPWPFDEQIVNLADTDLNPSGANYTVTIKPKGYVSATNTVVPLEGWADRVGILVCEAGTSTTPLLQWMPLESASDGVAYLIGPPGPPGAAAPATRGLIITDTNVTTIPAGDAVDNLAAYYNSGSAPITVQGTSIAAGAHAVWAWVSGAWTLLAAGTGGDGTGPTTVTPTAPTANDTAATVGTLAANSYRIPATTGVDYKVGGVTKAAGDYSVGNVTTSVTVTAFAQTGYVLSGTDSWTFNFTASATWVTLAHDTFAGADGSQWHGRVLDQTPGYAWNRTDASAAAMVISANRLQYNPGGVNLGVSGQLNPAPTTPTSPSGVRITLTYSGVRVFSVGVGYTSTAYGAQVGVYNLGVNLSVSFTGVDAPAAALTAASGQSLSGGPISGTQVLEIIGTTVRIYQDGTLRATGALPGALRAQTGKMGFSGGGSGDNYVDSYKLEVAS